MMMNKRIIAIVSIVLIVGFIILAGCAKQEAAKPEIKPAADDADIAAISSGISGISDVVDEMDTSDLNSLEDDFKDIETLI